MGIVKKYTSIPLPYRVGTAFLLGVAFGLTIWYYDMANGSNLGETVATYISPFGAVLVRMLKMVVIPIVFFSLIVGSSGLSPKKLGRVGGKVILWYMFTSLIAAMIGVSIAMLIHPGEGVAIDVEKLGSSMGEGGPSITPPAGLTDLVLRIFTNPFEALANGEFLPIIVFSLLFGLAARALLDHTQNETERKHIQSILDFAAGANSVMFKIVSWILEYFPIGVFSLAVVNFGLYGPSIIGPYLKAVLGVISGIVVMVFIVYSILLSVFLKESPIDFFKRAKEVMITSFFTRSSAATLPVTIKTAIESFRVKRELAEFSLPVGATINMNRVCIHLPMWAVFAADVFGIELTVGSLAIMIITTVLSAIGTGGVPGGSLMLLFIVLGALGLEPSRIAIIVALALGVNPLIDMFETMNNVTGDLCCTYIVAKKEDMLE
ncbi:MAG: dicarboxylate/amino acid:cation symporter [Thermococcus sp.]|nr:dicarboxylate/amino acid:cation symporter [Thermococcus sp.]